MKVLNLAALGICASVLTSAAPSSESHALVNQHLDARASSSGKQILTVNTGSSRTSAFGLGVFIENNINYGTDGGLYAELIRNRAFQEGGNTTAIGHGTSEFWTAFKNTDVKVTRGNQLSPQLPSSVILTPSKSSGSHSSSYGFRNSGFFGIPVKKQAYDVSFYARTQTNTNVEITVGLYDESGKKVFAQQSIAISAGPQWKQYTTIIDCAQADSSLNNTFGLQITGGDAGQSGIQLNLISVFPPTWEGTAARQDLAQAIADLNPVYFRLPGGNTLEGNSIGEHFIWNNSVGPLTQRQGRLGTWGGWDTDGYGLNEAYRLFSKMGAKPVLGVFAGLTLDDKVVPQSKLQPYLDSVRNEMHYLLDAPGSSALAKKRAQDGQEDSWTIPYVEIGNEDYLIKNGNITYNEYRYDSFSQVVSNAAPDTTIVSTSPYYKPKSKLKALDQHDYNVPSNLISRWDERDNWPRNGTSVAELEFSTLNSGLCANGSSIYNNTCRLSVPTLIGAVAEATFMMGLERNGDITFSAAYAPLFDHADHAQWTPDLIKFNALEVVKSTSYYVQQAFGRNRIAQSHNVTASEKPGPIYWSVGTTGANAKGYVVKLSNVDDKAHDVVVKLDKGSFSSQDGQIWVLGGQGKQAHNDIGKANTVMPQTRPLTAKDIQDGSLALTLPSNSFVVVTVPAT